MPNLKRHISAAHRQERRPDARKRLAIGSEIAARANKGVETAAARSDDTSRELLESILTTEEEYIDWVEAQLQIIEDAGLGLYLAQQMRR